MAVQTREKTKEERIRGEKNRLNRIFRQLPEKKKKLALGLIERAAFMRVELEDLEADIDKWMEEAGTLVGETDILFYPYGAEVEYPSDQLRYLLQNGLCYLCGLWGDTDFMELGEGYLRQTRRFVDGYTLLNAASYFTGIFDAYEVKDPGR